MNNEEDKSFKGYIKKKIENELMVTLSLDEIQKDWNITLKEVFFCLSSLNDYTIKLHPDFNWHIVVIDKMRAHAIAERRKDRNFK